jgi:hypothetical protein
MKLINFKKFYFVHQQRKNSKYFCLFYNYVHDILEKRVTVRPSHFAHVKEYEKKGNLYLKKEFYY